MLKSEQRKPQEKFFDSCYSAEKVEFCIGLRYRVQSKKKYI